MTAANPFVGKAVDTSGGGGQPASEAPPAGNRLAALVAVIDLGTHQQKPFQGQPRKPAREVFLVWELTNSLRPDGQTHVVAERYNLSFHKKAALRLLLESWRGNPYKPDQEVDLSKVVGRSCAINISHEAGAEGKVYVRVGVVTPLMDGVQPRPVSHGDEKGKPFFWFIGCGKPIPEYAWIPWCYGSSVKDLIVSSPEWQALSGAAPPPANGAAPPARPASPTAQLPPPVDPAQPLGPNSRYEEIPF